MSLIITTLKYNITIIRVFKIQITTIGTFGNIAFQQGDY
jgi:hypothetical protein